MTTLDLALIGNGAIGALLDAQAGVVWCCLPRFDGDPVFCSLLGGGSTSGQPGAFTIELEHGVRTEQIYVPDTPILLTRLYDNKDGGVEITDFCPSYERDGELVCPTLLIRQVRPIGGTSRIRVRLTPAADYGCTMRQHALGAGQIVYSGDTALRLTTDVPVESIVDESFFDVHQTVTLIFGLDEQFAERTVITSAATTMLERTTAHWRKWSGALAGSGKWRDAMVRAAITLELNVYEPT